MDTNALFSTFESGNLKTHKQLFLSGDFTTATPKLATRSFTRFCDFSTHYRGEISSFADLSLSSQMLASAKQ